jgi:thioredoxin-related protein
MSIFMPLNFDAEQKTPVTFQGKKWEFVAQNKANQLAVELMKGQMSYPTTIFMDENFENGQPMPGYLEVFKMESILKYLGGNNHKTTPWNDWQRAFKAEWE